jgi:hypothetical protein
MSHAPVEVARKRIAQVQHVIREDVVGEERPVRQYPQVHRTREVLSSLPLRASGLLSFCLA